MLNKNYMQTEKVHKSFYLNKNIIVKVLNSWNDKSFTLLLLLLKKMLPKGVAYIYEAKHDGGFRIYL